MGVVDNIMCAQLRERVLNDVGKSNFKHRCLDVIDRLKSEADKLLKDNPMQVVEALASYRLNAMDKVEKDLLIQQCQTVMVEIEVEKKFLAKEDHKTIVEQKINFDRWHNNNLREDERELPDRLVEVDISKEMEQQNDELGNELKAYMGKQMKQEFKDFEDKMDKIHKMFEEKTIRGMEAIERILYSQRNDTAQAQNALQEEIETISN